jgi:hypothetical protein
VPKENFSATTRVRTSLRKEDVGAPFKREVFTLFASFRFKKKNGIFRPKTTGVMPLVDLAPPELVPL